MPSVLCQVPWAAPDTFYDLAVHIVLTQVDRGQMSLGCAKPLRAVPTLIRCLDEWLCQVAST